MNRFVPAIAIALSIGQAAELPVREVVLYKHGVGFFSRAGELKAGETARLDFKADDMNDVLKSLTIEEKGGGKIVGLRYDSSEPLAKKLEQFPFAVGDHFSMSAVFDQMKGARVELKYGSEPIAGQIVSGRETVEKEKGSKEQLVLLLDNGEVRTLDLGAASGVRFLDPAVQRQFADYLRVVAQSRVKEKRSVYLDSTSSAAGSLVASYMIPTPVWKSSYRLVFGAKSTTLEGWAIVDNTTDEDWSNVRLALVSGRPISFISQLYEPKYRQRPTAELAEDASVEPVVYEGGVASGVLRAFTPPMVGSAAGGVAGGSGGGVGGGAFYRKAGANPGPARSLIQESDIAIATSASERGDLFEYSFDHPVTVKKSESAMLPFLQQKINTRKLLIFQEPLGSNPRTAAEITNSTGKTLDGGPITVYDDGTYAGEALFGTLKPNDKRLISYAVDLGTRVATKIDSGEEIIRQVTAKRGVLYSRVSVESTKTYTIRNVDPKPKTLIIEQPIREGFRPINVKPVETTASAYRFEVKLDPAATQTYVVKEEAIYQEEQGITGLSSDSIMRYISNRPLIDSAKLQLGEIIGRKKLVADLDAQLKSLDSDISDGIHAQDRLRENIASLNAVAGQQEQVQRYARQLAEGETKLDALRNQQRQSRARKQSLEAEVAALIDKLDF